MSRTSSGSSSRGSFGFTSRHSARASRNVAVDNRWWKSQDIAPRQRPQYTAAENSYLSSLDRKDTYAQSLDLCFLLDATQSMQHDIYMVKQIVAPIADGIQAAHPNCTIRVAIVIYGGYDDSTTTPVTRSLASLHYILLQDSHAICEFTSDFRGSSSKIFRYLSSVVITGGGDEAKDVFTGLERVARLDWQAEIRLMVHISDAPCSGVKFHDPSNRILDRYPHGDRFGRNITVLLKTLRQGCKINHYFFCHLNRNTRRMIEEFKRVIGNDNHWIEDGDFTQGDSIPDRVVLIGQAAIRKTSATLASSSNARTGGAVLMQPKVQARRFKHKQYLSLDELLGKITTKQPLEIEEMDPIWVEISSSPFSEDGRVRWPFLALILRPEKASKRVVKRFKSHVGRNSRQDYFNQMEVQTVSDHMARDFNFRAGFGANGLRMLREVTFILVTTLDVGSEYYNMEQYLKGRWIKYSNNSGYANTIEYAATLQAFSHWTYHRSEGVLMVTDLQGVCVPQNSTSGETYNFQLCNPAIHCSDMTRFTSTNLGKNGFNLFFQSHQCNDICRYLRLPSINGYSAKHQHVTRRPLPAT